MFFSLALTAGICILAVVFGVLLALVMFGTSFCLGPGPDPEAAVRSPHGAERTLVADPHSNDGAPAHAAPPPPPKPASPPPKPAPPPPSCSRTAADDSSKTVPPTPPPPYSISPTSCARTCPKALTSPSCPASLRHISALPKEAAAAAAAAEAATSEPEPEPEPAQTRGPPTDSCRQPPNHQSPERGEQEETRRVGGEEGTPTEEEASES
ncbi:hypothetical protein GGS23DRAFT_612754 [Durotheca rogersii]|uniref:uncharacterized protein n=1 Tax=Durotheca rogersii TaxID=419775 RepID=UPI002220C15B|nr:uncharacterized protein GGS23DRAFT_612754 [Durotheca rogersii]KAI5867604.1 hypothetical protein GGS23DRAFT_612754 [Durotheca rogersii]